FRDVARHPRAAIVIDDVQPPWRPRGIEIRGWAEAVERPLPRIRIRPTRIVSWGLGAGRSSRTIAGPAPPGTPGQQPDPRRRATPRRGGAARRRAGRPGRTARSRARLPPQVDTGPRPVPDTPPPGSGYARWTSEPAADRSAPTGGPDAGPRLRTAADHASTRVPVAAPGEPVDDVLARLRGVRFDSAAVVAVCARDDLLVGLATIEALLAAPPSATVGQVMDPRPVTVAPDTDQEQAAWQAARHGQPGLAVVDTDGRFRGLVPTGHLLGVLLEEHQEDLARMGGVLHTATAARATTVESVPRRISHRLPWIALGLLGAMVSAGLMIAFERQLDELVLIAFFVPGIVYLADAIGTQTEVLAIRGLSVGVGIGRIAGRETLTGLLL